MSVIKVIEDQLFVNRWVYSKPYEMYEWCEDDFYADENYTQNITVSELFKVIDEMMKLTADNGLSDWARLYEEARDFLSRRSDGMEQT